MKQGSGSHYENIILKIKKVSIYPKHIPTSRHEYRNTEDIILGWDLGCGV
jgi:hypothetical protein